MTDSVGWNLCDSAHSVGNPTETGRPRLESDMTPATTDFASAETFPGTLTFGGFIRRFVPELVVMALLLLVLVGALLRAVGAGGAAVPVAAVLVAGVFGALVALKKRQFDATWGSAGLELSPAGATIVSRHARVHLPWDRIVHLGRADVIAATRTPHGFRWNATLVFMLISTMSRRRGRAALIGRGTTTIAPGTPRHIQGQIRANNGCRDIDATTGLRLTAIVLPVFEKHWDHGRIGEWIRTYRPDIMPWT